MPIMYIMSGCIRHVLEPVPLFSWKGLALVGRTSPAFEIESVPLGVRTFGRMFVNIGQLELVQHGLWAQSQFTAQVQGQFRGFVLPLTGHSAAHVVHLSLTGDGPVGLELEFEGGWFEPADLDGPRARC